MLKKSLSLGVIVGLLFVFSISFISAYSYNVTEVNSTFAIINITNAVDLYSYEISFICNDSSASAAFSTFLANGGSTSSGYSLDSSTGILSVYESRLDSTGVGVSGNGTLFNLTHTCDLTTRQAISVLADVGETEETACYETAVCGAYSACTGGWQSSECTYPTCDVASYSIPRACSVETITVNTGGGGGGSSSITEVRLNFGTPKIEDNGDVTIPLTVRNAGTKPFSDITLSAYLVKNGEKLSGPKVKIDKEKITSLSSGTEENVTLSTKFVENDLTFYEVVIQFEAASPSYTTTQKALFTFVGKKAANVLKVVAFTEGIIDEHPECLELRDMIEDAQLDFKEGRTEQAITKANAAVEACKSYLENPLRPIYSQQQKDNILLYLGIGIVAAILFGIIFNIYRYYKFK